MPNSHVIILNETETIYYLKNSFNYKLGFSMKQIDCIVATSFSSLKFKKPFKKSTNDIFFLATFFFAILFTILFFCFCKIFDEILSFRIKNVIQL